jgi:hypothetical protein
MLGELVKDSRVICGIHVKSLFVQSLFSFKQISMSQITCALLSSEVCVCTVLIFYHKPLFTKNTATVSAQKMELNVLSL